MRRFGGMCLLAIMVLGFVLYGANEAAAFTEGIIEINDSGMDSLGILGGGSGSSLDASATDAELLDMLQFGENDSLRKGAKLIIKSTPGCSNNINPAVTFQWNKYPAAASYALYLNDKLLKSYPKKTTKVTLYVEDPSAAGKSIPNCYVVAKVGKKSVKSNVITATLGTCSDSFTLTSEPFCYQDKYPAVVLRWTEAAGATAYDFYINGKLAKSLPPTPLYYGFYLEDPKYAGQTFECYLIAKTPSGEQKSNEITAALGCD